MIAFVVAMVAIVGLLVFMWIGIAREPGPSPADVALAYEHAWDELNFGLLFDLSGAEIRDGMGRDRFVARKKAAYAQASNGSAKASARHGKLGAQVSVETLVAGNETALVVTKVEADGGRVRNNVMLERRSNGWVVVAYSLRPDAEAGSPAS